MNRLLAGLCFAGILGLGNCALAAPIDLGHPTFAPFFSTNNGFSDRNVSFDVTRTFSINSAGIVFDPLVGGAMQIGVAIYDVSPPDGFGVGVGSRNSLLATATSAITDLGVAFYDIPINFTFNAGTRYDVGFISVVPDTWGSTLTNMEFYNMEFYHFTAPTNSPYSVGGLVTVLDGGSGSGLTGGFVNTAMPHIRFDVVPEPSNLILAAFSFVGFAAWCWRRRNR